MGVCCGRMGWGLSGVLSVRVEVFVFVVVGWRVGNVNFEFKLESFRF